MIESLIALWIGTFVVMIKGNIHFSETFSTDPFAEERWIKSEESKYANQPVIWTGSVDAVPGFENDKGLMLSQEMKYYGFGSQFSSPFEMGSNKEIVIQYDLKFEDTLSCGGAYVKLLRSSPSLDLKHLSNDTPYTIMFGPDKCGTTSKVHFILQHQNPVTGAWEEKHGTEMPSVKVDKQTHLYTLVVREDNSFEIFIDRVSTKKGNLLSNMDPAINPPEVIDDPDDKKPVDWVDDAKIPDPAAVKPEDWDENQPRTIPDPAAVKPEGWDESAPLDIPDPNAIKPEDWDDEEV
jgi:calnexin